ncbi:CobW family GTP-binding protein [Dyadobacter psychrotolerans]|nr:GTP-binding protein [Dyadobacter psychrotolerans]
MEAEQKINVYLITGFLGAGKTTVLNHLLKSLEGERNVVIENEFGKVSVDGSLISKSYSDLYELNNGCICCSLDEELYDVLSLLARSNERAHNLFIETTGVADAGNVAAIFKREDVSKVFNLRRVICIADAETVEDYLGETNETIRQVIASDLIVINKIDLVTPEYALKLKDLMSSANPFAEVIFSKDGTIPEQLLYETRKENQLLLNENLGAFLGANKHKIVTVTYRTENEFYKDYLLHTLNVTLMIHYSQIYRIKGFIKLEKSNEKILLQSTGKRLTLESHGNWETDDPVSELVFIGIGLQTPAIQRILRPAIKIVNAKTKAARKAVTGN